MNCSFTLLAVIFFSCISASAQTDKYYVRHFNSENGLPQNSIKGIETDNEGYLWLATEMGAARYDGSRFRIYDQINTPQLKTDRMMRVGLLGDSALYFETDDGKFYLKSADKTLTLYSPNEKNKRLLDSFSLYKSSELYERCKTKAGNDRSLQWIIPDARSISRSLVNSVRYIHGRYYYFNESMDFISVDPALSSFKKNKIIGLLASVKQTDKAMVPISLLSEGEELFMRYGDWIYKLYDEDENEEIKSSPVLYVGDIPNISCFRQQREMNIFYVGTLSDGLYIFQKQFFSTLRFTDIESNVFYAQAPFGNGGVFTKKGVLFPDHVVPLSLTGITSESIAQTREGHYLVNIWKSKDESGIAELDHDLKMIHYIPVFDLHVNCFRQLKNGTVWIGGDKYFMGKIQNQQVSYVNRPAELPQDFFVICFIQVNDSALWIGGNKGLAKMDTAAKKASPIPELSGVFIRALYQDKKGTIWIGSYGKGYYAWYKNHLIRLPIDKNNYLATAHSFLEDRKGFLWITTNMGLFQVSTEDLYAYLDNQSSSLYYQYYDQTAGFLTNEFNGGCNPSVIELQNGKFSFPSMKSLVQFYPDSVKPILPDGPIHLDAITADTMHIGNNTDSIIFSKQVNRIQFFISSPYFGNAYNQEIEYQITELDNNWYPVDDNGIVQTNKPPSGHYQLLLRKKSGFGKDKFITKRISFFVQPGFRETLAFRLIWIFLFAGLAYLFYRIRVGFLLRQKKILEKEVYERTKEQENLIEDLENTIRELEDSREELHQNNLFKQKLAIIITHDLQSPLRFLLDAIRRVHKKSEQNQYADLTNTSMVLIKATEEVYHFVEDFGLWLSSMGKDFNVKNETINLDTLLVDLEHFFSEQLKAKENRMVFQTYKPVFVYTDWQLLKIILRNIIDNANKHTQKGIVEISTHAHNGSGSIIIKDNGKGMDEELVQKLNQRLKQKSTDYKERESGYGYRFVIDFCRLLNIEVDIKSELGHGTIITLSNLKMTNA